MRTGRKPNPNTKVTVIVKPFQNASINFSFRIEPNASTGEIIKQFTKLLKEKL